jgi:hypothetical protein
MANNLPYGDYIPTERDLFNLIGEQWPEKLRKDYIASKFNFAQLLQFINENTADIADIQVQITTIDGQIVTIQADIATLESDLEIVADDLADHVAATVAHGATGDVVGNLNYASSAVGGVVLEAVAVADAGTASIAPPAVLAAAGAAYSQAYAQSQTDAINTLITNVVDLRNFLNSAITVINSSLASERGAKQRAI